MQISLPRLNGLKPTLESTALKLMEEAGELAQAIGKHRGMSGERAPLLIDQWAIACELFDVAQTAVTMLHQMQDNGIDLAEVERAHLKKLRKRGYLIDAQ